MTGLTLMMQDITAKQLQLLKDSVPGISKVGVLLHPDTPDLAQLMAELERAAARIGVSVLPVVVGTAQDLPRRFNVITAAGADAYFVLSDTLTIAMRDDIAGLALCHRLPGAAQLRTFVAKALLKAELLPPQHKPAHVQICQQW